MTNKTEKKGADQMHTLVDIVRDQRIPGVRDIRKYRKLIDADRRCKNYLQPVIIGTGNGRRYMIKESNLRRFLAAVDKGYRNTLQV